MSITPPVGLLHVMFVIRTPIYRILHSASYTKKYLLGLLHEESHMDIWPFGYAFMCPYALRPRGPCAYMPICPCACMPTIGVPVGSYSPFGLVLYEISIEVLHKGSHMPMCTDAHMPICPYVQTPICPFHMPTLGISYGQECLLGLLHKGSRMAKYT